MSGAPKPHAVFVAAENGALPKGKVGGIGDVIRDLPAAIAREDWDVTVVTPSYGMFHELPGARQTDRVAVTFRGIEQTVDVVEVPGAEGVTTLVFEHPLFSPLGPGQIYNFDADDRPFATDASKFAFFCAAVATWANRLDPLPDVLHLHDWHAAMIFLLRAHAEWFEPLRSVRTVFTIHNLSYQGVRPIAGDESSLQSWFPLMPFDYLDVSDPNTSDCINPMAMAIRLADRVSTVSPQYAGEITRPSDPETGFIGGEGLEDLLAAADQEGRLTGVLNGCEYRRAKGRRPGWQRVLTLAQEQLQRWQSAADPHAVHALGLTRLAALPKRRPRHVVTSIGRLVAQKVGIFLQPMTDGRAALEHLLEALERRAVLILVGSGEARYEREVQAIAERHENLLFICGYSETLAEPLYRSGDLFLMPSSFEPCGISQMLAMRDAQPCVVHGVGGLVDTVQHEYNGFVFGGESSLEQAENFITMVLHALWLRESDDAAWQDICIRAANARFSWRDAARQTIEKLYVN